MTENEFVTAELKRFSNKTAEILPFRVAISSNYNGSDYAYGSHTEQREYADSTIGYTVTITTAEWLLREAYMEVTKRNEELRNEQTIEDSYEPDNSTGAFCLICGKLFCDCE